MIIWLCLCSLENLNKKSSSGKAKLLGTLVCICGAMILTLYKGKPLVKYSHSVAPPPTIDSAISISLGKRTERWTIGSIALVAGTLLWSSWFLIQSNIGKLYPCQYSSTTIMSFFGAVQSAVISLSIDRNLSLWILKGKLEIFTVIYAVSMLSFKNILPCCLMAKFFVLYLILATFSV